MRRSHLICGYLGWTAMACWCLQALAQSSVGTLSCSSFRDANNNPNQQALFMAYLEGYSNASSPDPRYTKSQAALEDDAKKIHDWCGKNAKSTYAEAVATTLGSAVRSAAPPTATVASDPTFCKVGPTNNCAGCSISCPGGKQAVCKEGTDNLDHDRCVFKAQCSCK